MTVAVQLWRLVFVRGAAHHLPNAARRNDKEFAEPVTSANARGHRGLFEWEFYSPAAVAEFVALCRMRILAWLLRLLCNCVIFVGGIYFVLGIIVGLFILTGIVVPGQKMYVDLEAPSLREQLQEACIIGAILAPFVFCSIKLEAYLKKARAQQSHAGNSATLRA